MNKGVNPYNSSPAPHPIKRAAAGTGKEVEMSSERQRELRRRRQRKKERVKARIREAIADSKKGGRKKS